VKPAPSKGTYVYPLIPGPLDAEGLAYLEQWANKRGWHVLEVPRYSAVDERGLIQVQARVEKLGAA